MSFVRKTFGSIWTWGKKHKFHFGVTIVIGIMAAAIVGQHTQIVLLHDKQAEDKNNLTKLVTSKSKDASDLVKSTRKDLEVKLDHLDEEVNARVDIIDDTINIDAKRRELISRIRRAIEASTTKKLGARDLNRIANAVIDYSYEWNFTIPQVLAQMRVESNFDVKAVSHAKAMGLMQIIPETAVYIQHTMPDAPSRFNVFNIHHSIRGGCFYLDLQVKEFGDYEQALRAYNWGPHNLRDYNAGVKKSMPLETQNYVPQILEWIEFYKKHGLESE